MKDHEPVVLNCDIVRDLLPLVLDGVSSPATDQAVEQHLAVCPDCADAARRMLEPAVPDPEPAEQVDYLKKVRRRGVWRAVLGALAAVLVLLAAGFVWVFVIGGEATLDWLDYEVEVEDRTVSVEGCLFSSGNGAWVAFSERDGVVQVRVRAPIVLIWNSASFRGQYKARQPVRRVMLDGRVIWEDGHAISRCANMAYEARNPYVGDMAANARLANALGTGAGIGSYTNALHTDAEPYGWDLILSAALPAAREEELRALMQAHSIPLLALTGNLRSVTWLYKLDGGGSGSYTLTAEDATALLGQDVKSFSASPAAVQQLLELVGLEPRGVY